MAAILRDFPRSNNVGMSVDSWHASTTTRCSFLTDVGVDPFCICNVPRFCSVSSNAAFAIRLYTSHIRIYEFCVWLMSWVGG